VFTLFAFLAFLNQTNLFLNLNLNLNLPFPLPLPIPVFISYSPFYCFITFFHNFFSTTCYYTCVIELIGEILEEKTKTFFLKFQILLLSTHMEIFRKKVLCIGEKRIRENVILLLTNLSLIRK